MQLINLHDHLYTPNRLDLYTHTYTQDLNKSLSKKKKKIGISYKFSSD